MEQKVIINFKETGECLIDVELAVAQWGDSTAISQWKEEYTLFDENSIKVRISKVQAEELIDRLDLLCYPSTVFASGWTWKK